MKKTTDENDLRALDRLAHSVTLDNLHPLTPGQRSRWETAKRAGRESAWNQGSSNADYGGSRLATHRRLCEEGWHQSVPALRCHPRADGINEMRGRGLYTSKQWLIFFPQMKTDGPSAGCARNPNPFAQTPFPHLPLRSLCLCALCANHTAGSRRGHGDTESPEVVSSDIRSCETATEEE